MADRSISSFDLFSHRLWLILVLALNSVTAQAQYRKNLNKYWQFKKEGGVYRNVEVPHTWNAEDPFDDEPGYYRGKGYYLRDLIISEDEIGKALYLKFEAVNQYAIVSINGHELTKHKGGYTAFLVGIPPSIIHKGKNQLVVEVDNSHDPDVVPLKGDFNFYGGIYRDVWLEVENKVHFGKDPTHGTEKLKLHSEADEEQARLNINASIYSDGRNGRVSVGYQLYDADNLLLASYKTEQTLTGSSQFTGHEFIIKNPRLWSPDTPYLYHIEVLLKDIETGDLLDAAYEHYGFRYFRFDPDSGFYLNGKQLKLIGANRHQDYPGLGNALSNDRHRKDIKLLKEMGANFFRTAHYPQDQAVLNACDSLGLLVSMEIPFDHEYTNSETFLVQTKAMLSEMILQYYNHPSIIIWASMNEMFLGRSLKKDIENIENIVTLGHEMENQMRSTDPSRYTMIPNHGAFDLYHQPGLTQIPMLVGWNLYFGWYENDPENLTRFLNHFHEQVPDKPVIITEYGAGADPRIRSLNPERFDFSIDWQFQYHMSYLNQFEELDYLSGAAVWNLFDFGSEFRQDAVPHINSKGLMSYDRQPKDTYFLYRARLTNEPFAEILPTQFPVLPASLKQDTLNWPIKVVS
ncbi:MAG: glycoside hydrolase family 2 protein, partial [Owenweeksia sp.]